MQPNFGWHYPPGVTNADIDRAAGSDEDEECSHGVLIAEDQPCSMCEWDAESEAADRELAERKEDC